MNSLTRDLSIVLGAVLLAALCLSIAAETANKNNSDSSTNVSPHQKVINVMSTFN